MKSLYKHSMFITAISPVCFQLWIQFSNPNISFIHKAMNSSKDRLSKEGLF